MRPPRPALRFEPLEDRTVPAVLDLTSSGTVAAAGQVVFTQYDGRLGDPAKLRTFAELDGPLLRAAAVQGYNTDARPVQFSENTSSSLTRALRKTDVPAVTVGGVLYREFVFDGSQTNLLSTRVSLDQLRIYSSGAGNLGGYSAADKTLAGQAPVYDLDAGGDSWVVMNLGLASAVGGADMRMYVPDALLTGDYVTVYSKFGEHYAPTGAVEKWSVFVGDPPAAPTFTPPQPPPPPASPPPPAPTGAGIAGTVFGDANGNDNRDDSEVGLANRVVYLDANENGQLDSGEVSATTDADGYYAFTGLTGGATYPVRVVTSGSEFALSYNVTPADGTTFTQDIGVSNGSQN